jgi:hypothetical protein
MPSASPKGLEVRVLRNRAQYKNPQPRKKIQLDLNKKYKAQGS